MITIKQWEAHPSFRKELEDALQLPAVVAALEIVLHKGITPVPVPAGAVDLLHFAALTGSRKEGYIEALMNLRALSENPATRRTDPPAWNTPKSAPTP